jgi:regulatory protein
MRGRPKPSLKARAVKWLAQREHSRAELRQKLWRQAQHDGRTAVSTDPVAEAPPESDLIDEAAIQAQIETLLDSLEAENLLNDARFAQSRIRVRAPKFGAGRIRGELTRLGVSIDRGAIDTEGSESERAHRIWARKFGANPSEDRHELARQCRFLASRGFSSDVIRRVVSGKCGPHPDQEEPSSP